MNDLSRGFDLKMLRKDGEVVAGFSASTGVFQFKVQDANGQKMQAEMPVLDLNFTFANGRQERISITPDSSMAMIAVISEWAVKLASVTQGAPPPAPPVDGGLVT